MATQEVVLYPKLVSRTVSETNRMNVIVFQSVPSRLQMNANDEVRSGFVIFMSDSDAKHVPDRVNCQMCPFFNGNSTDSVNTDVRWAGVSCSGLQVDGYSNATARMSVDRRTRALDELNNQFAFPCTPTAPTSNNNLPGVGNYVAGNCVFNGSSQEYMDAASRAKGLMLDPNSEYAK